jgi:hypothetical protein
VATTTLTLTDAPTRRTRDADYYATTEVRVTQKNNRFRTLNNCVPAQSLGLCGFSTSLIGYTLVAHACSLDSGHSGSRWVEQRHKGDTRGLKAQANRGFARGSWDKAALEAAGIEFLPAQEGSVLGVRLRQIARGRKTKERVEEFAKEPNCCNAATDSPSGNVHFFGSSPEA